MIRWFYLILAVVNIAAAQLGIAALEGATKALLIPLLAMAVPRNLPVRIRGLYYLSLTFSWLGDMLLFFERFMPVLFIAGLVAFLTAHLLYLRVFKQLSVGPGLLKQAPWAALPFLVYGVALVVFLFPGLDDVLRLAVPVYAAVLLAMSISAVNLSRGWLFAGALCFVASDSLLAINAFHTPLPGAPVWILSTYWAAQGLLFLGIVQLGRRS